MAVIVAEYGSVAVPSGREVVVIVGAGNGLIVPVPVETITSWPGESVLVVSSRSNEQQAVRVVEGDTIPPGCAQAKAICWYECRGNFEEK